MTLYCFFLFTHEQPGLTVHQIPYIVGEAPSNLLLKHFTPSKWQSRIIITWGICLMTHAAVHNKGGLYATRFLLGLVCYPISSSWNLHAYQYL